MSLRYARDREAMEGRGTMRSSPRMASLRPSRRTVAPYDGFLSVGGVTPVSQTGLSLHRKVSSLLVIFMVWNVNPSLCLEVHPRALFTSTRQLAT